MRKIEIIFISALIVSILLPTNLPAELRGIKVKAWSQDGSTREIQLYSGYHALVVGCGNYRSGWPRLQNPVKDAREVAATLRHMGWKVDLLEDPDWSKLRRALNSIIVGPGRQKDKAVLFWFSGHGHTLKEAGGKKLGYIVPVDAPDPDRDELGFMEHAISMRQIETVAKRVRSKHVIMLFDTCFSGAIFQAVRSRPTAHIEEKVRKPVRMFITAGTENEQVPDQSVFKVVFLQALRDGYADRNKDGYVTGLELGDYLQEQVINYSRKAQHPQFGKINDPQLDKGDFVFILKAPSPSTAMDLAPLPKQPEPSGVRDLDKIIEMRKATKDKWGRWQARMGDDYTKAERYDRSSMLNSKEKAEVWADFLSSYGTDNPHTTRDDELRAKAQEKLRHWQQYKVAAVKKTPTYTPKHPLFPSKPYPKLSGMEQYIGILTYRTGPFAAGGSGKASGWEDFMALRNMQGGVNGIKYKWEECETAYNTARGVECFERMKNRIAFIHPFSTGITYALIPRATKYRIPVISSGYGRADASDGTVFPYVFTIPATYWSLSTAKIKWIAKQEGWDGKDMSAIGRYLKGLKIANLHLDLPYGLETKPILEILSKKFGFQVRHFPVPWPGIDQKAQWMDIARRFKADWVINRNWGVSCTVPLQEAAKLGFPRDRIIGIWWCGAEEDVEPAGLVAKGYYAAQFHGVGRAFPLIQDIIDKVYGTMKGNISFSRVGSAYYNAGVVLGIINEEAMRTAHKRFGIKVLTGEEMQWGLEHLNITKERISELGVEGLMPPINTSYTDHEGGGLVMFHQWDGAKWVSASDWIPPMREWVRAIIEKSAAKYAKEKGITIRTSE